MASGQHETDAEARVRAWHPQQRSELVCSLPSTLETRTWGSLSWTEKLALLERYDQTPEGREARTRQIAASAPPPARAPSAMTKPGQAICCFLLFVVLSIFALMFFPRFIWLKSLAPLLQVTSTREPASCTIRDDVSIQRSESLGRGKSSVYRIDIPVIVNGVDGVTWNAVAHRWPYVAGSYFPTLDSSLGEVHEWWTRTLELDATLLRRPAGSHSETIKFSPSVVGAKVRCWYCSEAPAIVTLSDESRVGGYVFAMVFFGAIFVLTALLAIKNAHGFVSELRIHAARGAYGGWLPAVLV